MSHEQRLATPLEDDALSLGNSIELYFDLRQCHYVGGCTQSAE